jgi:hypothetical protein
MLSRKYPVVEKYPIILRKRSRHYEIDADYTAGLLKAGE